MAVTIKEIADYLGISKPTVSRILNNKGYFSSETKRKVFETARQLGYRPNRFAKAIATGRFGSVALLMNSEGKSDLPGELLESIHDSLMQHDIRLSIARLPDEKLTAQGVIPQFLKEWMADGLIINYNLEIPDRLIQVVKEYNIPSVWLNVKREHDCIYYDNYGAGKTAAEQLLKLGHHRIMYVDLVNGNEGGLTHYSSVDRYLGFRDVMKEAYLGVTEKIPRKERIEFAKKLLSTSCRTTGIVAGNAHTALAIQLAALALGIRIPQELSLIAIDEESETALFFDNVAMVLLPIYKAGQEAVKMLMKKIQQPAKIFPNMVVACEVYSGKTIVRLVDEKKRRFVGR